MNCPTCKSRIPSQNINIVTDVAQCEACELVFKISDNVSKTTTSSVDFSSEVDRNFDVNNPPKGAWIHNKSGELVIGATTRSAMAFFIVPFMCVWSGFSLGGIYGTQIISGEFDLFTSLFGIPFILGSILFWGVAAMTIWGKVEVTLDHTDGRIFTGVGKLGRTKRFSLHNVSVAREETTRGNKGNMQYSIVLEGQERVEFGTFLNPSRRYYILKALQKLLADKAKNKNFLNVDFSNHLIQK